MRLHLRRAGPADLTWIEHAVRSCPIAMEEFGGFYGEASTKVPPLVDDIRELLMIMHHNRQIGFLDVDVEADVPQTLNVTYFVAPQYRRRGFAAAAVDLLARRRPEWRLTVAVRPSNAVSLAVARSAGFSPRRAGIGGVRSSCAVTP